MNPKIERCIDCTTQCTTQTTSDRIVKDYQDGQLVDQADIKFRVSVMSQNANRIGCPDSEIVRVRRETAASAGIERFFKESSIAVIPSSNPSYDFTLGMDSRKRPPRL